MGLVERLTVPFVRAARTVFPKFVDTPHLYELGRWQPKDPRTACFLFLVGPSGGAEQANDQIRSPCSMLDSGEWTGVWDDEFIGWKKLDVLVHGVQTS